MNIVRRPYPLVLFSLLLIAVSNLFLPQYDCQAASQRTLAWSIVDTPSDNVNSMVIRSCGINDLALGPDNRTFYAVSTDNTTPKTGLFKSTDAGYSWSASISSNLARAGASFPVWNIAVAPDDANFIIAVTDNSSNAAAGGPRMLYYSIDGGSNWENTTLGSNLSDNEYISCLCISTSNAGNRDIAIGTRSVWDTRGRLFTARCSSSLSAIWTNQPLPVFTTAVTSVKFSPNYILDQTIAMISFTATGAYLHLGKYDIPPNPIQWDNLDGGYTNYPVLLGTYPASNIIRTGIELPSDYTAGTDMILSGCFINLLGNAAASAVFYVRPTAEIVRLTTNGIRIYSIAYSGTNDTGILLAGEATANPTKALARVWQCFAAQVTSGPASWMPSDTWKSPTGGGGTGFANVLLAWNADGSISYCGTSSESSLLGGTAWAAGHWPFSRLAKTLSDESAFQYSSNNGAVWNQIGIINTLVSQLSDIAVYERPEEEGNNTLFLATLNTGSPGIDSIWRSTSNPLGLIWERVLTWPTSDNGIILRINLSNASSTTTVFADLKTTTVISSSDEGDLWGPPLWPGMPVNDISLWDDSTMYVLGDYTVCQLPLNGQTGTLLNTNLVLPGHTICTPITSSSDNNRDIQKIVIIGTEGNDGGYVAWADFTEPFPKFTQIKELPVNGEVHVMADNKYDSNKNIYAAITTGTHNDGNIYRWTIGTSTNWDELDPINRSFFGICMMNDVLYGAWNTDRTPLITSTGVDRTLEARGKVPPPLQWDELHDGLPDSLAGPLFTCEPASLHASSNTYNTLWAIDNRNYDFNAKTGCLWSYVDSVAMLGPWPTAPPPGSFVGPDPSSGRAHQIDFKWRPLKDIFAYDVLLAKDANFTLLLGRQVPIMAPTDNMTSTWIIAPVDNLTGAWIVTPADQENPSCWISPGVLEAGRSYYWKVRGSRTVRQTPIHSPWSPTLFFSVKPGFSVTANYMGPTLLAPGDGLCFNCQPPIRFSWSPIEGAQKYEFLLANDAQFGDVIVKVITQSTGYEYKKQLKLDKPYFWQVRAYTPVPGDPSPVGTFTLSENLTTPQNSLLTIINYDAFPALSNLWIWIIILIIAVLLFVIAAYIFISRMLY